MLQEITAVKSVSYCISRRLNEASSHPNFYIHGEEECLWLHVPALKGYEIYKEQILLFALLPLAWESAETLRFKAAELHSCGSCEWSDRDITHQHPDIPAGMLSVGHTCLAGSVCSCLGSCFPKCRMLCPLSLTSGRARGISELLLWDKTPESPPHQQPGPGKVRVRSEAPWAAAEWSNAELCFF